MVGLQINYIGFNLVKLETSGKSYKASSSINYDPTVVNISNLLVITALES